ncbi:dihydrofolate reductase [Leeia sp. TBRC 13508]|uniref:Dihydrofolate reductase n=1 Tax=Leeia speluncae TaxID=2884804 RepID=A0ABS8D1V6_9NEIS|nr:dihydrofolate reductase [Leeia speluncae]MCB6181948.1 dihydrofolate reductase [Leeia speluncae]
MNTAKKPRLTLIAAMASNRVIGIQNRLPWKLSEDLKYFKKMTSGHTVIMGRKTFDSLGKPLPGRTNLVITRNMAWQHEGVTVCHGLEKALSACRGLDQVFVIGGAELYQQALPIADELLITEVQLSPEGDAFFPDFSQSGFNEVQRESHVSDDGIHFDFVCYHR